MSLPYVVNNTGPVQNVNHPAKIWGTNTAILTEDDNVQSGELVATGRLIIVDADFAQSFFTESTQEGRYGTLTLCVNGHWMYTANNYQYAFQSLGYGYAAYDSFTIQSADGTKHNICVKINGINDRPCIWGDDRGSVTENTCVNECGYLTTEGKLCIKDIDIGESHFIAGSCESKLGCFKIDSCGNWQYQAKNDQAAIQCLSSYEGFVETFTVKSCDGTTHQVRITIHGNDENVPGIDQINNQNNANGYPPVVLDLNDDGKVALLSSEESNVTLGHLEFFPENTVMAIGWVGSEDGILVYDPEGEGKITSLNQISFISYDEEAKTDLEGLKAFDSNNNLQLDVEDIAFKDFAVWQDKNSNGTVDGDEFFTLAEKGIVAISLVSDHTSEVISGNIVHGYTSFETDDGQQHLAADVELNLQAMPAGEILTLADVDSEYDVIDLGALTTEESEVEPTIDVDNGSDEIDLEALTTEENVTEPMLNEEAPVSELFVIREIAPLTSENFMHHEF